MLEDFKDSVGSVLKERIVSPIFGAFVLSWCVWNYQLLYYIFTVDGDLPVEARLNSIKANYINLKHGLWYPLFSSIALLFLTPVTSSLFTLF